MKAREAARRAEERGRRVYAIGDVHGRLDLLETLLVEIGKDCASLNERAQLIFLGDYIDRGLHSREVIDRLLELTRDGRFSPRFLKGNHEAALLDFLARPESGAAWLTYGGAETLYSYGVAAPPLASGPASLHRASEALRAALPDAHLDFLSHLELWIRHGDHLFVHAGLRPGRGLDAQDEQDLLTIRDAFHKSWRRWPFTVVHGHTPVDSVYIDDRRICVDTGAYITGRLSAVCIDQGEVRVLST